MKALGIVAEYNPFHNGHKYHLNRSLELSGADILIAAISGDFTQRGEFAILDKWKRAEIAVNNGVNLVVEIPTIFACNNAGYFAKAGIEILENLNCEYVSFGVESKDKIEEISKTIVENDEDIENGIKAFVKEGLSYPKAREKVLSSFFDFDISKTISSPNNILAIEYLKNIKIAKPLMIERKGSEYKEDIKSASNIRDLIENKDTVTSFIPKETYSLIENTTFNSNNNFFNLLKNKIIGLSCEQINQVFGASEGLGNIVLRDYRKWKSYDDMISSLKSKRYTETHIKRLLAHILLNLRKEDIENAKPYIRVLAFDEKGSEYLREVKKHNSSSIPIITNINKDFEGLEGERKTLSFDILASDLYNASLNLDLYKNSDFVKMPIKISR